MRKLQILTNSEGQTYDECPAKHGYAYHELLRPLVTAKPLQRGTLYHAGVAAGWREAWSLANWHLPLVERVEIAKAAAQGAVDKLVSMALATLADADGDPDRYDQMMELGHLASWGARYYFQLRQNDLDGERFLPMAIEQPFSVRLPNARGNPTMIQYEGVIDLVLFDREANMLRIEDHKMPEDGPSALEKKIDLDTQTTGYLVALQEMQKDPKASFWKWALDSGAGTGFYDVAESAVEFAQTGLVAFNVMRGKIPSQPRINQRNDVSTAECSTLPEIYEQALLDQVMNHGIEISPKQRERLEKIRNKSSWFAQIEFYRSADDIARWRAEIEIKARMIRESGRDPSLRVRRPVHCSSASSYTCAYKAVCIDPTSEAVRRNTYRIATDSHEEVAEAREENGSKEELGW